MGNHIAALAAPPRTGPVPRRRPGGRNERIRGAVAETVLEFFRHGRTDFSVAEVAERAGVHRSTIYRRWPTPADLIREALTLHTGSLQLPDTGSWEADLRQLGIHLAAFFSDPVEVAMNVAMVKGTDPALNDVLIEHWLPVIDRMAGVVTRAIGRGEVSATTNPTLIIDLLVSPLLVHTVLLRSSPSSEFIQQLTAALVRASRP